MKLKKSSEEMNSFISISKKKKKSLQKNTKATQLGDIPGGIIKGNNSVFDEFLSHMFKFFIDKNAFANGLYNADIKSVYKKDHHFDKNN